MQENLLINKNSAKNNLPQKAADFFLCALVFSMIALPRIFQIPKVIILFLICVCLIGNVRNYKKRKVFSAIYLNLLLCVFGTFIAIINNNDIKFDYFKVNFLWYIILLAIFFQYDHNALIKITKTAIWASAYIAVYNILLIFHVKGSINLPLLLKLDATANVGFHDDYIHIVTTNISMLMFTAPLIFSLFIFAPDDFLKKIKFSRISLLLFFVLNVLIMVLSGRRVMWINTVFLVAIVTVLKFSNDYAVKKRRKKILLFSGICIAAAVMMFIASESLRQRFFEVFDSDGNIRFIQIAELWKGFLKSPVWGVGFGHGLEAGVPGYEGSAIFEVTYNLLLYNTGIIGISLYIAYVIKIIRMLYKEIKKNNLYQPVLISALIGFLVILFSNASNPYLGSSFDFHIFQIFPLWAIYLSQGCKRGNLGESVVQNKQSLAKNSFNTI